MGDLGGTFDEMCTRGQAVECPFCSQVLDAHAGPNANSQPVSGDVTMCWYCGSFSYYVRTPFGLQLRKPTTGELQEILDAPSVRKVMSAMSDHPDDLSAAIRAFQDRHA